MTAGFQTAGIGPAGEVRMGFCGHIGTTWVDTPTSYVNALTTLGGKIMREDIKWGRVEPTLGNYEYPGTSAEHIRLDAAMQLAQAQGIETVAIFDYGISLYGPDEPAGYKGGLPLTQEERTGFANYAAYLSGALAGRPVTFEVWNEWNIPLGATTTEKADGAHLDPAKYDLLVKDTYAAVKATNPDAFIWGGVLSDPMDLTPNNNSLGLAKNKNEWFEQYIAIPGWADHIDGFSFHHYLIPLIPEYTFWQVRGIAERARAKAGRPDMPVMLSETGWFNGTDSFSVAEDVAADYYSRIPFLLRCAGIDKVVFYAMRDDGISAAKEDNFGVYSSTYVEKPAATVLGDILPEIHAASGAEYRIDRNRHAVILNTGVIALWAAPVPTSTVTVRVVARSTSTATIRTAGGSASDIALVEGVNDIEVDLTSRAKLLTLPAGVGFDSLT